MKTALMIFGGIVLCGPLLAAEAVRDLNTLRTFPKIESRAEWKDRAAEIREHVQFATGLWPLPPRTPLNDRIFGRLERDGYSVEKVYFETYPGFFLAGNLYRPLGKGIGPFPAILNPHGHWKNGRMADEELGSIAARCISFARQGMVAFSYDMVGYNDTVQVDHKFASDPKNLLWNISLMGLQTWNSIRALDFLESLPDVDRKRLACTGESGGGTQTFILGAIDDRLAAQAPIVMVSHSMQGGCLCENAPGLRVDYSNMEIAAAPAPRPQIMVSATGDWTRKTMEVEGPSIEKIYELFRAEDRFDYAIFDYPHNYNKETREAVYAALGKWLLKETDASKLKEQAYTKEPDAELRVFPEGKLPQGALKEPEFIESLVRIYSQQLEEMRPRDRKSLKKWKEQMEPAWEHALQLQHVSGKVPVSAGDSVTLRRTPDDTEVSFQLFEPKGKTKFVVLDTSAQVDDALKEKISARGGAVALLKSKSPGSEDQFKNYFHTYNRTYVQDRAADIKVALNYLRDRYSGDKIILRGEGDAALACLAAAPLASAVVVNCGGMDESKDEDLLKPQFFFPGSRHLGSIQGILALAAPNPVLLHNFEEIQSDWLTDLYKDAPEGQLKAQKERASSEQIAEWITRLVLK